MFFHRELTESELQAEGVPFGEARHAANRRFGNDARLRDQSHETVGFWFEGMLQDFRFAIRQLRKNPGFAVTAILILTLGIGASVAIFGFVDAALIKPLPYKNPSLLVGLFETTPLGPRFHLSYLDYLDWKKFNKVFSSLEAYDNTSLLLNTATGTQQTDGATVSDGFFRMLGVAPVVRNAIWSVDKDQPVVRVATMNALVAASEAQRHFALVLFAAFALTGLVLAATGVYGVVSGGVIERMREIGIRAALGASRADILAMVVRQGMALTGLGIAIGLIGAVVASRAIVTLLFGVSQLDAVTYTGVIALLLGVSAIACLVPAWRAARVDPSITLRAE